MWDSVLRRTGFRGVETEVHDCDDEEMYSFSVMSSTAAAPPPKFEFDISLVTVSDVPADWLDRLRLNVRRTVSDHETEVRALAFHTLAEPPRVKHFLEAASAVEATRPDPPGP